MLSKLSLIYIVFTVVLNIYSTYSLTGTQASNFCHCDLTSSFCDFGCCCDNDCSSAFSNSCFYQKSKYYCPNTDFYFKTSASDATSSSQTLNCYYYNSTTTINDQVSISASQKSAIINTNQDFYPLNSTGVSLYQGYKLSSTLTIGGVSSFIFSSSGDCLNSSSGTPFVSFKFGQNVKISCKCVSCGSPLLFSMLMGKKVSKFLSSTNGSVTIPTISDSTMTSLTINFVIGKYGSQNVKYIDRVTHSYSSNGGNVRTLMINFFDSDTIKQEITSTSFFPQIPRDMFYPIHLTK